MSSLALRLAQAREGQGGLTADVQQDDRVVVAGATQLVVEQALVDDADVLGAEVGEVDRAGDPARTPTGAHLDLADLQQPQQTVDDGIRWARGFERRQCTQHRLAVPRSSPGRKS